MSLPKTLLLSLSCLVAIVPQALAKDWLLPQMVGKDKAGQPIYQPRPMDSRFKNPISDEDECGFQARARNVIAEQAKLKVPAGNTYFENEKRTYGLLMAQVLAGDASAVKGLQLEDAQAKEWHRDTQGIDFYPCFTLKHQTRKYFYFGEMLEPEYRARMLTGAKAFTEKDPLNRPHWAFKAPGGGWGPDQKNSWVDVRNTENLYLMRVTSVYLLAEESGNAEVRDQYKREIQKYAKAVYRVGMGEWDSENYHGHSIGPLCNLYDFAKDDEVRLLAKACLDWVFASGAVKYYRGGFNGPSKRDYNHVQPFGGSAANMLSLHFGDCPTKKSGWESDEVHLITSNYRPPAAVIQLARKNFARPVEIFASKPHYSASTTGDTKRGPQYLETQYFGKTFQLGSLASGTSEDGDDVNGFKILAASESRGADAFQCVPGPDALFVGSPKYQKGKVSAANRVAQLRNMALWLVRDGSSPWTWVVPESVKVTQQQGVTFLEGEQTWVAVRPLGASALGLDEAQTQTISQGEKAEYVGHKALSAKGDGGNFCGLAIEVGEQETDGQFAAFQKRVLAAEVDVSKLDDGIVQYKSGADKFLGIHWNDKPEELGVWRNGERHDWQQHAQYLYRAAGAETASPPLFSRWNEGTMYVEAGGQAFTSTVTDDGRVTFANGTPAEVKPKLAK